MRLCERIFLQSIYDAGNAVLDERHLEVDQQPEALVRETEVSEELLLVNRVEHLDGLDFHDHFVFDDQIGPESGIDSDGLIDDRDRLLALTLRRRAMQTLSSDK